ncbi:hypothetical protein ACLKOZ_17085 [Arthrobacter sp. R4]|uniref:hypothetical protein n=1 Tax=Arthrobacter sp. R4 TaxID=644417 RepID=UPI003EDAEB8F
MAKTIAGVPESITREAYLAMFDGLGIDIHQTKEIRFAADGIYASVFERDEHGNFRVDGDSLVLSTIFIPVKE